MKRDDLVWGCSLLFVLCLILFVLLAACATKTDTVRVVSRHWRIEQQVEDFQARHFEDWDERVPEDAYAVECRRSQRGSHQECTGTGDDRRCHTEADYDQWCSYRADRWGYLRSEISEGDSLTPVLAPEPRTRCTGVAEFGCERYGAQLRTFTVSFVRVSDNSEFDCNIGS